MVKSKVFISAFRGSDGSLHDSMKALLDLHSYKYIEVIGSYKGMIEKSFMVDMDELIKVGSLKTLARIFKQDSILFVNSRKKAVLVHTDMTKDSIYLGDMNEVDESIAKTKVSYTYIPSINKYFVAG